jgi:hypothetical protein
LNAVLDFPSISQIIGRRYELLTTFGYESLLFVCVCQNSVHFVAFDMLDQPWRLKISVRKKGKYLKPWICGQWRRYVLQKKLRPGDRVTFVRKLPLLWQMPHPPLSKWNI